MRLPALRSPMTLGNMPANGPERRFGPPVWTSAVNLTVLPIAQSGFQHVPQGAFRATRVFGAPATGGLVAALGPKRRFMAAPRDVCNEGKPDRQRMRPDPPLLTQSGVRQEA